MSEKKRKNFIIGSRAGIGDLVQMIVIFRNLKISYPHSKINLVTSQKEMADILKQSGIIDNYYYFGNIKQLGIVKFVKEILKLRKEKFDTGIIDVIANQNRWRLLMHLWGCREVVYTKYAKRKMLFFATLEKRYFTLLKKMQVPIIESAPTISKKIFKEDMDDVRRKYLDNINTKKIIGVCIRESLGARDIPYNITKFQETIKVIPMYKTLELINLLTNEGYIVALLGGSSDKHILNENSNQLNHKDQIIDLVGQLNLKESLYVMSQCELVIGGDFGLVHMADSMGTNTLIYYGSTSPEYIGPFSNRTIAITAKYACQYCFHKEKDTLCKDKKCLEYITSQLIYDEVKRYIMGRNEKELGKITYENIS